jgi:DNA-directed RNA polymerase III subunit RPC3
LTLYIALTDNILHRMRFPKFLVLVKGDVGDQAEAIVEGLLEHGRLTLEQLIQRAAARAGKAEGEVATVVKDCFQRLLANHYIERCPVPEPSLCPNIAVEPAKKTARGAEVSDLAPGCGPNREWASCPDSNLDATSVFGRYQTSFL